MAPVCRWRRPWKRCRAQEEHTERSTETAQAPNPRGPSSLNPPTPLPRHVPPSLAAAHSASLPPAPEGCSACRLRLRPASSVAALLPRNSLSALLPPKPSRPDRCLGPSVPARPLVRQGTTESPTLQSHSHPCRPMPRTHRPVTITRNLRRCVWPRARVHLVRQPAPAAGPQNAPETLPQGRSHGKARRHLRRRQCWFVRARVKSSVRVLARFVRAYAGACG